MFARQLIREVGIVPGMRVLDKALAATHIERYNVLWLPSGWVHIIVDLYSPLQYAELVRPHFRSGRPAANKAQQHRKRNIETMKEPEGGGVLHGPNTAAERTWRAFGKVA